VNEIAWIAALVAAIAHICTAPLEMVLFARPTARKFLHVDVDNLADARMWAFVVGFRNLLAGIGILTGLTLLGAGNDTIGRTVVLTVAAYMLLASLAMGLADLLRLWRPRGGSVPGTVASSLPPLIVLIAGI